MPEQDIYIESLEDPTEVIRPLDEASDKEALNQPIFAAAKKVEHNPMALGENPLGPFPKGAEIGVTLGEWLAASGEGTYRIEGSQATLDVSFENLVPNGVYTAWCGVITVNDKFSAVDMPCGYLDGSQAEFQADENGNAIYSVTMPALPISNDQTFSDIAFAYHSDGQTCGSSPCIFGQNSHVHVFISDFPPAPTDLP